LTSKGNPCHKKQAGDPVWELREMRLETDGHEKRAIMIASMRHLCLHLGFLLGFAFLIDFDDFLIKYSRSLTILLWGHPPRLLMDMRSIVNRFPGGISLGSKQRHG
jgi:hypothetical protein